jgi:hypothetical protein
MTSTPEESAANSICTVRDDYVRDCMHWGVELNDGTVVYEDDDRPGADPPSAWLRLRSHCGMFGVYIVKMWLQFRSHRVELPADAPGYYFIKSAFGFYGLDRTFSAYIVGIYDGGDRAYVVRFQVPEIEEIDRQIRVVGRDSPSLIARGS